MPSKLNALSIERQNPMRSLKTEEYTDGKEIAWHQ
jgi:hypothetical protein